MKNIKQKQLQSCIVVTFRRFRQIIQKLYNNELEVYNAYKGLSFYSRKQPMPDNKEICKALSDYFDVSVTSFHSDDEEPGTRVWIAYQEDRPWLITKKERKTSDEN